MNGVGAARGRFSAIEIKPRTKNRRSKSSPHSDCGSRTETLRGHPCSQFRRPRDTETTRNPRGTSRRRGAFECRLHRAFLQTGSRTGTPGSRRPARTL